jgi:hypothetical protein
MDPNNCKQCLSSVESDLKDMRSRVDHLAIELRSLTDEISTFKRYGFILVLVFLLGDKGGNVFLDKVLSSPSYTVPIQEVITK